MWALQQKSLIDFDTKSYENAWRSIILVCKKTRKRFYNLIFDNDVSLGQNLNIKCTVPAENNPIRNLESTFKQKRIAQLPTRLFETTSLLRQNLSRWT